MRDPWTCFRLNYHAFISTTHRHLASFSHIFADPWVMLCAVVVPCTCTRISAELSSLFLAASLRCLGFWKPLERHRTKKMALNSYTGTRKENCLDGFVSSKANFRGPCNRLLERKGSSGLLLNITVTHISLSLGMYQTSRLDGVVKGCRLGDITVAPAERVICQNGGNYSLISLHDASLDS